MPKPRTPKPAAAPGHSIPAAASPRQIASTGREYHLSAQMRQVATRAQFQPRLINICSNVQD